MKKLTFSQFVSTMGLLLACLFMGSPAAQNYTPPPAPAVAPQIATSYPSDADGDGVEDDLHTRYVAAEAAANSGLTAKSRQDAQVALDAMVDVELIFAAPVTQAEIDQFVALGGEIAYMYRAVSYGWNGRIPLRNVEALATVSGGSLVLVETPKTIALTMDEATQTGRVRPVWANGFAGGVSGFNGDSTITIAILDTGIDSSHTDLSGRQVYWEDFSTDNEASPIDMRHHGTHVAGIALGTGASHGSSAATLHWTSIGDLSGVANGSLTPSPVMAPTLSTTMSSTAHWTGGGSTTLYGLYHPAGNSGGWTTISGGPSGTTGLTESNTFTGQSSRVYSPGLLSNGGTVEEFVVTSTMTNYPAVGDGFNTFSGVAPGVNWAGAKTFTNSGSSNSGWTGNALDDLVAERINSNIKVVNMSIGTEGNPGISASTRQKVNTAVNNGMVVVVSAGNDGTDGSSSAREVDDPGRAAMAITVAATNDANEITGYSSHGFTSLGSSSGSEEDYKPDIAAPGGSITYHTGILSADSNSSDGDEFDDETANDYYNIQGTSMAAPFVSGAAALVIDAMQQGGVTWDFSSNLHSSFVKMVLCATATETNTDRETGSFNPTLQRAGTGPNGFPAGKDKYEGYGMMNPDAAVEAVFQTYVQGDTEGDTLGSDVADRRAWARKVQLNANTEIDLALTVPGGADFDLYLYDAAPNAYGTPIVLASSTGTSVGADEAIDYTPGSYVDGIVVVKRISGAGAFSLTSTAVAPEVDSTPDQSIEDGIAYSRTPNVTGGSAPIVWEFTESSDQPTDMAIDGATGEVTWTSDIAHSPVDVQIRCEGPGGTLTRAWTITVITAPTADFSPDVITGELPLTVVFTDTSSDGNAAISDWAWNFGDSGSGSNTSTLQDPIHTYIDAGTYTVALTVTNAAGEDTETKTDLIIVSHVVPVIGDVSDTNVAHGVAYSETPALSQGSGSIVWSLTQHPAGMTIDSGTGELSWSTDYEASPADVTVQASGPGGSDTESWTITVDGDPPTADFQADSTSGTLPFGVNFTDQSSDGGLPITAWAWDFGDTGSGSNTSTLQDPSHTYEDAGTYTVALTVTNAAGEDTETKTDHITVSDVAPVIEVVADATIEHGDAYSITPTLSAGTGMKVWSLTQMPAGMTIDSETGEITWSADVDASPASVTVQASGPGGSDTESWTLTVNEEAPVIDEVADLTVEHGTAYGETPTLSAGTGTMVWSLTQNPVGMTIDSGTGEVSWTAEADASPAAVTVQAIGPGGSDTESWTITVNDEAPVIDEVTDLTVEHGTAYGETPTLSAGTGTMVWSLTQNPTGMTIDSGTGEVSWTADAAASPAAVTVQAAGPGGSDTESWSIAVESTLYVAFGSEPGGSGSIESPYNSLAVAVAALSEPGQIIKIQGESSETVTLTSAMRLEAYGGTVRIGASAAKGLTRMLTSTESGAVSTGDIAVPLPALLEAMLAAKTQARRAAILEALSGARPYEPAMPGLVQSTGARAASNEKVIAIRLLSAEPIDFDSLWGELPGGYTGKIGVEYFAPAEDARDVWVLFQMNAQWNGEALRFRAGGLTVSGAEVVSASFAFTGAEGGTALDLQSLPPLEGAVAAPVDVRPRHAFAEVEALRIAIPENAGSVDLWYYKTHGDDQGWHAASTVLGLLAGEPAVEVEDGVRYLRVLLNHAGIVQIRSEAP